MAWLLDHRDSYTPAETRADAVIHVAGLVLVGVGVPVLMAIAVMVSFDLGDPRLLWSSAVYAMAFASMIGASALFNLLRGARLSWLYQRIDHSAIYLKIAGSYTPLTFIPGQALGFATAIWAAACLGVAIKLYSPIRFRKLGLALYLGMGWAGVAILPQLWGNLPLPSLALILAAGAVYTLGVVFYLAPRLRYHYAIWHVCVLVASVMIYAAILGLLVARWGHLAQV